MSFWVNLSEFPHKGIAVEMKFQSGTLIFSSCSNVAAFLLRTQKGKATEWFSTLAFDTCRHVIDKADDEDIRRPYILVVPEWFFNPEFISHTSVFASVGCYDFATRESFMCLKGPFWRDLFETNHFHHFNNARPTTSSWETMWIGVSRVWRRFVACWLTRHWPGLPLREKLPTLDVETGGPICRSFHWCIHGSRRKAF